MEMLILNRNIKKNEQEKQKKTSVMLTLPLRPPSRNLLINALNRRGLRAKPTMTKES
jgi:hypothetical protein